MSKWQLGNRVSFAASPAADNRTVYTGTITEIKNGVARVVLDSCGTPCGVALARLHGEGQFTIATAGPVGVRWKDTSHG